MSLNRDCTAVHLPSSSLSNSSSSLVVTKSYVSKFNATKYNVTKFIISKSMSLNLMSLIRYCTAHLPSSSLSNSSSSLVVLPPLPLLKLPLVLRWCIAMLFVDDLGRWYEVWAYGLAGSPARPGSSGSRAWAGLLLWIPRLGYEHSTIGPIVKNPPNTWLEKFVKLTDHNCDCNNLTNLDM